LVRKSFPVGGLGRTALVIVAVCTAACAQKAHPQTRVEPPPALTVPIPPPRVIVPPQPEPSTAPVEDAQAPSPSRPRPPRPAPRPDAKPEAHPDATSDQAKPPSPDTQTPAANSDLQPADAAGVAAIRQQMTRASQDLMQVNYSALSSDLKTQYDTANRFLQLAEQALRERNLLFASTLADKAGAIAALLTGK
jgi:outer membrane biosynthesis protein TonB